MKTKTGTLFFQNSKLLITQESNRVIFKKKTLSSFIITKVSLIRIEFCEAPTSVLHRIRFDSIKEKCFYFFFIGRPAQIFSTAILFFYTTELVFLFSFYLNFRFAQRVLRIFQQTFLFYKKLYIVHQ